MVPYRQNSVGRLKLAARIGPKEGILIKESEPNANLERVQSVLKDERVDLLLVAPSADLRYLIGHAGHASERLTLLSIPSEGVPTFLAPALELPGFQLSETVRAVPWYDGEDPFEHLRSIWSQGLRPSHIAIGDQTWAAVLLRLQELVPECTFISANPLLRALRILKSPDELELLSEAGRRADAAFADVVQMQFSGRSEREFADILDGLLHTRGLEKAGWGPIVGSGPHSASPHHVAGERVIREGDAVVLDFGGTVNGYQADITRTVYVGSPSDEFRAVYACVCAAQEAAVAAATVHTSAEKVDAVARGLIAAAGYGDYFIHRTGHGLGLDTHEEPYLVAGNTMPLEAGMVFSVEPGVYIPGRFGIRIEDTVAVSEQGPIRFNQADRSLLTVR